MKAFSGLSYLLAPAIAALCVAGCSGGGGGGGGAAATPSTPPPEGLTYSASIVVYVVGTPIVPLTATLQSGEATSFTIQPALPAGLEIDATTGTISGTPTTAAPTLTYRVTASNSVGQDVTTLLITVTLSPTNSLGYETPRQYSVGVAIEPNVPTAAPPGGMFEVAPPLPLGLTLNPTSGAITGIPSSVTAAAEFMVSHVGAVTTISILTISVVVEPPSDLSYLSPATYYRSVPAIPNLPTVSGTPPTSYTVTPTLPLGMTIAGATGVISGTPVALDAETDYTVTATNSAGSTTAVVTIEVVLPSVCALSYASPVTYVPDAEATDNVPEAACALDHFTVSPALPAGLTLDEDTGVIGGTPENETPKASYTISASGSGGFIAGTIVVITIGPVYDYVVENVADTYSTASGIGSFIALVTIEENANNAEFPHDIAGFQMGIAHDAALLTPVEVDEGSDLLFLNSDTGVDFFGPSIYGDGITLGVLVSLDLSDALVADEPKFVAEIEYETVASELAGDADGVTTALEFVDTLGSSTPIVNVISLEGVSITPVLHAGTVELDPQ